MVHDFPNPNKLIQTLHDDVEFRENVINYLNDIIKHDIDKYRPCNPITQDSNKNKTITYTHAPHDHLTPVKTTFMNYFTLMCAN